MSSTVRTCNFPQHFFSQPTLGELHQYVFDGCFKVLCMFKVLTCICMCMYVYTYVYTCVCVCVCVCVCERVHMHLYACVCVNGVCICVYV